MATSKSASSAEFPAAPLTGKVALITGGASGLGLAIVHQFFKAGAQVATVDITGLDQFQSESNVHGFKCDITKEEEVDTVVDAVMEKWGHIDILVNNAGVMDSFARVGEITNETWKKCFAVNVDGPLFLIRRCVNIFQAQETKGCIINICSVAAVRGAAAGVAYTASKHALLGISRNTAWQYAKEGIRCNVILPGGAATNIMGNVSIDPIGYQTLAPYMSCMPGLIQPNDVAKAALFLATSSAINGAELTVDQGWLTA